MSDPSLPTFSDATLRLRSFLTQQGFSSKIVWLCREDVFEQWPKLYVKVPLRNESLLAERAYNEGVRRELGAELAVFCFLDGTPCCYVWIPHDEIDASYRMLSGLKLTIREPGCQIVVPVNSLIRWFWLKFWSSQLLRRSWAEDIPRRNAFLQTKSELSS